jgi:hypothetical protein
MIRHNNVRSASNAHFRVDTAVTEGINLVKQSVEIHDTAIAENTNLISDRSARHEREFVFLPIFNYSMAGVITALIP